MVHLRNQSGKYAEIGGIYKRESKPLNGYIYYRHTRNKKFVIRFDNINERWILDCSEFDATKIVASRKGFVFFFVS